MALCYISLVGKREHMKKIEYVAYAVAIVLSMRKVYLKAFKTFQDIESRKLVPGMEAFYWYTEEEDSVPF